MTTKLPDCGLLLHGNRAGPFHADVQRRTGGAWVPASERLFGLKSGGMYPHPIVEHNETRRRAPAALAGIKRQ